MNPKKRRNCHFHNIIFKIERELQSTPIVEIVRDEMSENEAYQLEIELIKKYGRIYYDEGGILTNVDVGGKGPTEQSREKISNSLTGRSFSIAHKSNLSRARKEQKIPPKAKLWKLQSPIGETFEIINLKEFCNNRGLSYDDLKRNIKGTNPIRRGPSIGWRVLSISPYLSIPDKVS